MNLNFTCFTAIIFYLALIIAQSFGELVVLRHPPNSNSLSRNLTCISEDDGAALIWNYNSNELNIGRSSFSDFLPKRLRPDDNINSAVRGLTGCVANCGKGSEWYVVNSRDRPMGPVLDYRWEGFKEFVFEKSLQEANYQYVAKMNESSDTLVFSARGSRDIHVFLCEKEPAIEGKCIRIIIGGLMNTESVIESCATNATLTPNDNVHSCRDLAKHKIENIIAQYEWRTFVIKWIEEIKRIQVYKDGKEEPFLQGYLHKWHSLSHISVKSLLGTHVRFHFYEYFESKTKGAKISTSRLHRNGKNFCAELFFGLCPGCRLDVNLVDNGGRSMKNWNIFGDGKSMYNGMLSWRSITLNATSLNSRSDLLKLEIKSILNRDGDQGRWAIGNLRTCRSDGRLRKSTVKIHKVSLNRMPNWPEVNCQKLSYNKSAVVDSISENTIDHYTNELKFHDDPSYRILGERWSICNPTGCMCDRGYQGSDCGTTCAFNSYGYKCIESCGSCDTKSCDKLNGYCKKCSKENLLPPLCKKELEKPSIVNVTDHTVRLVQNVEVELDEWITEIYIEIESKNFNIRRNLTRSEKLSRYTADIENLTRDTIYMVKTIVHMKVREQEATVNSLEVNFTTTCLGKPRFELSLDENIINVTSPSRSEECIDYTHGPFFLESQKAATVGKGPYSVPVLPHSITQLESYTEYEVNIFTGRTPLILLWTTKVFTLESAPGKVKDLKMRYVSDTEVTLQWMAPFVNRGVITGYRVSIQRKAIIGCEILEKQTPQEAEIKHHVTDTRISVNGLHPYAKYTVNVVAHTTKDGQSSSLEFQTDQKYIPTSAVHNLQLKDNNRRLEWKKPKDCTTISGNNSAASIFIAGLSEWAKNSTHREETNQSYFDIKREILMPYTEYKVQVHVIREFGNPENLTCYRHKIWRTESDAPLEVTNFEMYDANLEEKKISLRWSPPYPPRGEIESYGVTITKINSLTKIWPKIILASSSRCRIWKEFICFENLKLTPNLPADINIQVDAKNKYVKNYGPPGKVNFTLAVYNKLPMKPKILEETFPGPGVVEFKWEHPFSDTYITEFKIYVKYENTTLVEIQKKKFPSPISYSVKIKQKVHSLKLNLAPSTRYSISIVSTNPRNSSTPESKIIQVPNGFGFLDGEKLVGKRNGTLINLKIPGIAYATKGAVVQIVVDKNDFQSSRSSPRLINKTQLILEKYDYNLSTTRNMVIDVNQTKLQNTSCSLDYGKTCVIKVIVVDAQASTSNEIGTVEIELNNNYLFLICLCISIILAVCLIIFCVYCRRRCTRISRKRNDARGYPPSSTSAENLISLFTWSKSTSPRHRVEDRNSVIYAVPYETDSRVVRVEYFPEYAKIAATSGLLVSQYMMFPRDLTKPCQYGRLPQNIEKNRDKNLIAYDDTRVVLDKLPGEPYSDYINASYIQGHRGDKAYIATQGPMPNTVNDFWRMVWQEKVYIICMLNNIVEDGQISCEQYWPTNGLKLKYGEVSVMIVDHQVFADYTVRIIRLGCQKYKRKITHLHYTGWRSTGIPKYPQSLVAYLQILGETPIVNGPMVVHCSTGTGRTGTLILCDICLRQGAEEKVIDVLAVTTQIRSSRANMVGSSQQYILAHVVIMESITSSQTGVPCTANLPELIKELRKQLPEDVERLSNRVWQERVLYSLVTPQCPTPGDFTRKELPAPDSVRPDVIYFKRYTKLINESNNYIGAVSVDGVKTKKQYLASQLPSASTWSKFWLIIAQKDIELIIILQSSDPRDPTCCNIIPDRSSFAPMPYILVETKEELREEDHFTTQQLLVTNASENGTTSHPVTVLTCTGWETGKNGKPPMPEALVSVWLASGKILRKESLSLVLCHDGVTGCGLYLALSYLLERMAVERECDVISAVRAVRRFRPEFVEPIEQFDYLYDAALDYAKRFDIYSNFT